MLQSRESTQQMNIPLHRGFNLRSTPLSATYRTNKQGLQENIAQGYFIYGHWSKLFGCWHVRKELLASAQHEILPDWPILFQPAERSNASHVSVLSHRNPFPERSIIQGRRASYWFAAYLNSIPSIIQDLCRPFGNMQWLALDLCHQIPNFYRYIHEERQAGRIGYMAAVFASIYASGDTNRKTRKEAGLRLMSAKRSDVLSLAFNQPITKSAVRLIERLPANLSIDDVNKLLEALTDPSAAKALRHAERITTEIIYALMELPADFRHPNIAALVRDNGSASYLDYAISNAVMLLTIEQRQNAAKEFSTITDEEYLKEWEDKWTKQGRLNRPFPAPPVVSTHPLVPITSYTALKAEGRSMHNCVESYWSYILSEKMYFFHWSGEEEASVNIISTPDGVWQIQEALGFKNRPLRQQTLHQIKSHLAL